MNRTKINCKIFSLLLCLCCVVTSTFFTACNTNNPNNDSSTNVDTPFETVYSIIYDKVDEYVLADNFNLSDLNIKIVYEDGIKHKKVTEDMVSASDLLLLKTAGAHVITVNYEDVKLTVVVKIKIKDENYEIVYENAGKEILISEFKLSDLNVKVTSKTGSTLIPVTEDMISASDLLLLKTAGTHLITVTYDNIVLTTTVKLTDGQTTPTPTPTPTPIPEGELTFTNAFTPSTYYSNVYTGTLKFKGDNLKLQLRTIINSTKRNTSYDDLKKYLPQTDAGSKPGTIRLFYSHKEVSNKWDPDNNWNREHVWPKSRAWYKNGGAGADIHHIRPEDPHDNSSRSNTKFGESSGYYKPETLSDGTTARGDVARIIFYMLTRYSQTDTQYTVKSVAESMEILLKWNREDPVDNFEIIRNNQSYSIQGNRNPFIDCPDLAEYIWGNKAA